MRYSVLMCRTCPEVLGDHWIVTPKVEGGAGMASPSYEKALEVVARLEVARLAGDSWEPSGEALTGYCYLRRVADGSELKFHSWALAARFLEAWTAAARAPLAGRR